LTWTTQGKVVIASPDGTAAKAAEVMIGKILQEAEIGKLYMGKVRKIMDFGAFVEIFPGTDGLVHISQLDRERVNKVTDVLREGMKFWSRSWRSTRAAGSPFPARPRWVKA
jgi:polyribonucleotide nucleotidyltransferase